MLFRSAVVKLGQHLERELGVADSNDTLARWMAHRIAEMMHRAETARKTADRESARAACADLILRLWEKRACLPTDAPLASFADFLENFVKEPNAWDWRSEISDKPRTWAEALPELRLLLEREMSLWREAALAAQPHGKAKELLDDLGSQCEPEETRILRSLAGAAKHMEKLRAQMIGDMLGTPPAPRTRAEQEQTFRDAIARLAQQRETLLECIFQPKKRKPQKRLKRRC